MNDIFEIEEIIRQGDEWNYYNESKTNYLKAMAKTQLLILKELREMRK